MPGLALSALLSQVLVAFTIECDNAFEHRMPHRTSRTAPPPGVPDAPWLVSIVMAWNCLQHLPDEGLTLEALHRTARTRTNLDGMRRWGYVTLGTDAAGGRIARPRPDTLVRPTPAGRRARETWRPLPAEIEGRWRTRHGDDRIDALRRGLDRVAGIVAAGLPDCLPILGYGLRNREVGADAIAMPTRRQLTTLPGLLSRVLLQLALEVEGGGGSVAIGSNLLRVLDEPGVRLADLPWRSGVSKEAIAMAIPLCVRGGLVIVDADPAASRARRVRLTPAGVIARESGRRRMASVEQGWRARLGPDAVEALRASLEPLVEGADGSPSPLFTGLEPDADGWRAALPRPQTLPHFPMVLHRGGFPDGS